MSNVICINVRDKALLDIIQANLKDKGYDLKENAECNHKEYSTIITDDISFLERDCLKENIRTPVLYISSDGNINEELLAEKNIFRAVIPDPDMNQVIEMPSKNSPVRHNSLENIVNFLVKANNTINKFSLMLSSDTFTKKMMDEKHFTEKGDYGLPGMSQAELQQIRGAKRKICDVEAAYQAVEVFKLFNSIEKRINGVSAYKILLISPDPNRMFPYAKFLEGMTSAFVEVSHEHDAPNIDLLNKSGYSLIIYDLAAVDRPISTDYLDKLITETWKNRKENPALCSTEILTMCNTEKISAIISDSKIGYKFRNFIQENPDYRVFLETATQILEMQSKRAIASLLANPENALFSEAIANLNSTDPIAYERGKRQLLYGIALKTGKNYPDLMGLEVNATDDLFFGTAPLKLPELGKLIKLFKDDRRAKCEAQALRLIHNHNGLLDKIQEHMKVSPGDVSKKNELFALHAPRINTRRYAVDSGRILIGQYIFGPTLDRLGPEISRRLDAGDKAAKDFRNQVIFEMNKYCTYFQINELALEGIASENTGFSKDFPKIIDGLKELKTGVSEAEYKCADLCSGIFDINIRDPASTQYSDFYWDNIIFETGNDADSFDSIMEKKKSENLTMQQFVEKYIYRIDFNKIYRRTSMTEDPSRWAVKNFMREFPANKEERAVIEDDANVFYTHLLLYRKKFKMLREVMSPACSEFNALAARIDDISKLISKWESKQNKASENDKKKIDEYISEEKEDFFYTERYVTAYRLTRHSILLFNSIKDWQKKFQRGDISHNVLERQISNIELDLRKTYLHTIYLMKKIIDQKKDCFKKNKWDFEQYGSLISDIQKEINTDIAKQVRDEIKNIKKIENPEERDAVFTYVSANYLAAFCKKVAKSQFNIDYMQSLGE